MKLLKILKTIILSLGVWILTILGAILVPVMLLLGYGYTFEFKLREKRR